ncbi:ABC transporter ATP-binding protein [Dehalococcoidia bacterium]|nr:ABC transporter ATP-binding protein [Dehalococcoidia bacterium]
MSLLEVSNIVAGYGDTEILHGVSVTIDRGEIVTVIGPNGSGKSTLMKTVIGIVPPTEGQIIFNGLSILSTSPEKIVGSGLSYVPQTANVFPNLTIKENLEMGAFIRKDDWRYRIDEILELFPDLRGREKDIAGRLSGGQRQMLALGRALMLDPVLLLLDEPTAGLAPLMIESVFEKILAINGSGIAIMLIEQNAREALRISKRGYVLAAGENQLQGSGESLLKDDKVARLYLGG